MSIIHHNLLRQNSIAVLVPGVGESVVDSALLGDVVPAAGHDLAVDVGNRRPVKIGSVYGIVFQLVLAPSLRGIEFYGFDVSCGQYYNTLWL